MPMTLDETDRRIINRLQDGFPIAGRPFALVAAELGLTELDLIERLAILREEGILTRFGPMYNADRFGGHVTLVAMAVPAERFDQVADLVNAYPQVAHNYARDHELNMWFVVAAESHEEEQRVLTEIQERSGLPVYDMPKLTEFHVNLRFTA